MDNMEDVNFDLAINFIDRNIGYRQFDELPRRKEGSLHYNKYKLEIEIFKDIKRRLLRDELKREPSQDEIEVVEMPESISKYF